MQSPVKEETLNAFHLMWDRHPVPVMLLRKNHDVVAVNTTGKAAGLTEGVKCFSLFGQKTVCAHCQARAALADGKARRYGASFEGMDGFFDGYWTPLAGEEDLFLHYGNDITEFVAPERIGTKAG